MLGNSLEGVPQVVQEGGPSKDALRQLVYRERKRALDVPAVPESRATIVIPEQFRFYQCGEVREGFLLADTGVSDENRYLSQLDKRKESSHSEFSSSVGKAYATPSEPSNCTTRTERSA